MPKRKIERFPLTLHHATGQWSKCFTLPSGRRKTVYFGTDKDATNAKYLAEKAEWQAGNNPRENTATASPTAITLRFIRSCSRATGVAERFEVVIRMSNE